MISVKTNKDIEDYQEEVLAGMNVKQILFALAALGAGIALISLLYFALGINLVISVYISAPVVMAVSLTGFGKKNGMSYWKRMRKERELKKEGPLLYRSTENAESYAAFLNATRKEGTDEAEMFDLRLRKLKKAGIALTMAVILIIVITIIAISR